MLEFVEGDMFDMSFDIRVNTVNCVGVMGTGVALAFKKRYPEMFRDYQRDCRDGQVKPGAMHVWKSLSGDWIINFPTKRDWREPSRYEDIDSGLDALRRYLNEVGLVRIALPALGCGNGGLDWQRVSGMIRDKLDGVEAHVSVFAPAISHNIGRSAVDAPTADERIGAEMLGFTILKSDVVQGLDTLGTVSVMGNQRHLAAPWIALLPSRTPSERELQALRSVAAELSQRNVDVTITLVHGSKASEEIADIFVSRGVATVLLLPFGVLTRKAIAKLARPERVVPLTLVSLAPPSTRWSRPLFAQTMDMLRANAAVVLLSDPEPDWLMNVGLAKWDGMPISYIRYESAQSTVKEALASVGAKAIGRRSEDGAPNLDYLINEWKQNPKSVNEFDQGTTPQSTLMHTQQVADESLTVAFDGLSDDAKRSLCAVLFQMKLDKLAITVTIPHDFSTADRRRLLELGFYYNK